MFNTRKDHFTLSLWGASLIFALLYGILSYNNRLAADDLYYLANYPKVGIWGCMEYLYQTYSARWSAYLFTGAVVSLSHMKWTLFIFHTFTLLSLIAILSAILHQILNIRLKHSLKKAEIVLYASITAMALFFTSYSIGETWFWTVQVCTYLWSIIMSLVLVYALLNHGSIVFNALLIVIAALFIGGSSESYALINLFLLGGYLFFTNLRFKSLPFLHLPRSKSLNLKLLIALSVLLIGFIITMAAPGNGVRYNALPHPSKVMLVWIELKSFIKIVFIRTPLNLPMLLLFASPWLLLGNRFQDKARIRSFFKLTGSALPYVTGFLVLIFVFLIPTSFIMAELGPDRALSMVSFFIALSFSAGLYCLGYFLKFSPRSIKILKISIPVLMIIMLTYHTIHQYNITSIYAQSCDKRMDRLNGIEENHPGIITLDSLAPSGMLFSAEISVHPSHFTNQFLKEATGLKRDLRVKGK